MAKCQHCGRNFRSCVALNDHLWKKHPEGKRRPADNRPSEVIVREMRSSEWPDGQSE